MAMNAASTMRPAGWSGELQDLQVSEPILSDENIQLLLNLCTQKIICMHVHHALDDRTVVQYVLCPSVRKLQFDGTNTTTVH